MLYTRKGDAGMTQLYGTESCTSKAGPVIEALGTLDELNTHIGLCKVLAVQEKKKEEVHMGKILHDVQEVLFMIQAQVAGASKPFRKTKVTTLERVTDRIERTVPEVHAFSLSGGTVLSAHLGVARTIARRAERRVVSLHEQGVRAVEKNTLAYLNRLSSLLFALERYVNHVACVKEESPTYQ